MKIIFLDFDGVITTYHSGWRISIEKLLLIDKIVQSTNAKIVITSSWKLGFRTVEEFKTDLDNKRCSRNIKTETPFEKFVEQIYDITDNRGPWRGDEIQRYIENNKDKIESYVILDDDNDMLDKQLFNFVQTDSYDGIGQREVDLCIRILNNERIPNPIRLNNELMFRWRINNYDKDILIKMKENNNIENLLKDYYNRHFYSTTYYSI